MVNLALNLPNWLVRDQKNAVPHLKFVDYALSATANLHYARFDRCFDAAFLSSKRGEQETLNYFQALSASQHSPWGANTKHITFRSHHGNHDSSQSLYRGSS
jgi:hypothetical protein